MSYNFRYQPRADISIPAGSESLFFRDRNTSKLIPVRPKNYRDICLRAIEIASDPHVFADGKEIYDFSDRGPLTQRSLRDCIDFVIMDGKTHIVGFHDHPEQMGISDRYDELAQFCQSRGWLKIEGPAS